LLACLLAFIGHESLKTWNLKRVLTPTTAKELDPTNAELEEGLTDIYIVSWDQIQQELQANGF